MWIKINEKIFDPSPKKNIKEKYEEHNEKFETLCELWCFHQFDEFSKNQKKTKVCGLWCFHQFDEFLQNFHFFEKSVKKSYFALLY